MKTLIPFFLLSAFLSSSVAPRLAASVLDSWGNNNKGQRSIPANLSNGIENAIAISAGAFHSLALRADNTVVAWGDPDYGAIAVPPDLKDVTAIAAGWGFSLALTKWGVVRAWGYEGLTNSAFPPDLDNVKAIAAGYDYAVALRRNGNVVVWGTNDWGQTNLPANLSGVVAISAGGYHLLALKQDGTVVAWGRNNFQQTNVPPGLSNIVAVAAGGFHNLALRRNGTVVAWGADDFKQSSVPLNLSNVVAISAANAHSLALRRDGTVVAWGINTFGQTNVPAGLTNVGAITGGHNHNLVLRGARSRILQTLIDQASPGDTLTLDPTTYYDTVRINKDLTLQGTGNATVVDGSRAKSVITILSNSTVTLRDITITNGLAYQEELLGDVTEAGGGIFNAGVLRAFNCTVRSCEVLIGMDFFPTLGVGIYNSGEMELDGALVIDCTGMMGLNSDVDGGGIQNSGTARIRNSRIIYCDSTVGGGIHNSGQLLLETCVITNCAAESDGGGIANGSGVLLRATNSTIVNCAALYGGGFFGGGTLAGCTVNGNVSGLGGGGFLVSHQAVPNRVLTLLNCTVSGNLCDFSGVGGVESIANAFLRNCTVVSNEGPAFISTPNLRLSSQNSILGGDDDVGPELMSEGYNLIQNTDGITISGNSTGNRVQSDLRLGALQDNGGATWTHALLPGSPAIDATPCGLVTTDQRGIARPFDFPPAPNTGGPCDIGAFELVVDIPVNAPPTIQCPPSLVVTNLGSNAVVLLLTGISPGPVDEQWQELTITASNSNPVLQGGQALNYVSPESTANLSLNLAAGTVGAGTITVTVDDGQEVNPLMNCNFDITVVAPPFIRVSPMNTIAMPGSTATFNVQAIGSLPLSYQWRFNGTNLVDGAGVSGAKSATLTLANVQSSRAGVYSVRVSNSIGTIFSCEAMLSIDSVDGEPRLFIQLATNAMGTNEVTLSWDAAYIDFVIEGAADLGLPINWQPLTCVPQAIAGRRLVTERAQGARFYRLRRGP